MRINSVWFFFLYNFPETLDKQREIGGEAFIAKSKEASLMRNYIQHVKEQRDTRHFFPCAFPLS